jgi:hypothetical protein
MILKLADIKNIIRSILTDKSTKIATKVAQRWLLSLDVKTEYDIMMRLQVLEGAANVPLGSWWQKGSAGLDIAKNWFADKEPNNKIDPTWFSPRFTTCFSIVEAQVAAKIRSYRLNEDPFDYITNALMGLSLSADVETVAPAYKTGEMATVGILSGKETPITLAKGPLGTFFKRRVDRDKTNIQKQKSMNSLVDEEGRTLDFEAPQSEEDAAALLLEILTDANDPLGRKIRDFMRSTWQGENYEQIMKGWLTYIERSGNIPRKSEIANILGLSSTNFDKTYWRPALIKFFKKFWNNSSLQNALSHRYIQEGVPFFQEKPALEDIIKTASVQEALTLQLIEFLDRLS